MAQNKTIETEKSVQSYIDGIADENRRSDFAAMVDLVEKATGLEPKMWGPAIVGFGKYHYKYESGREGEAPLTGLSSRANAITFYLSSKFDGREELLEQLGRHKVGKGCVYIQRLSDVDTKVLTKMIKNSVKHTREIYPESGK